MGSWSGRDIPALTAAGGQHILVRLVTPLSAAVRADFRSPATW
ncbi:hypothetical protein ACIRYZ_38570 [Kitasatospora sp. NPDC101155]